MKALVSILMFIATVPLTSYRDPGKRDNGLEIEKYLNFIAAVGNTSTFSYFTVIKVTDLNTGQMKEICTKGNFVAGAIHRELNVGYDSGGLNKVLRFAKSKRDRSFEFKNKEALNNISFYDYDAGLVDKIQKKYNFDKIVKSIKQDEKFVIELFEEEMKPFAHVLFNRGYLTGENNCFGGQLRYVENKMLLSNEILNIAF